MILPNEIDCSKCRHWDGMCLDDQDDVFLCPHIDRIHSGDADE